MSTTPQDVYSLRGSLSHLRANFQLLSFPVWTLLVLVSYILFNRWRGKRAIHALKQMHGCLDPAKYPHKDAWGSDLVADRINAMKNGRYFKLYAEHYQQYGRTWEEKVRGHITINTIEPANVRHVLALRFEDYGKDAARVKSQHPLFGPSIFSDGPQWKHSRSMVKPIFTRSELSDTHRLASFTHQFMQLFPDEGAEFDIQPLLHRLFLDISMDFIFGTTLNALQSETSAECSEFLETWTKAQRWVTKRRESGWLCFRYDYDRDWIKTYTTVHKFVDQQVHRALDTTAKEKDMDVESTRKRYILLDELARTTRDPIALRYQVLGVFLPARDTTSILVGNVLFELARHPHLWAQLRQAALSIGDEPWSFEKLKSLTDFRYVLSETIRLVGPAARIVRAAVRDTVLPVGGGPDQKSPVLVPKGTTVSMGSWCMNHDPSIWGEDVEQFKPERWIGRKVIWEFIGFGGGPRICPAQQQVLTHATYLLARLTRTFASIENRDPVLEYVEKFTMGFENRTGVKIALHRA